MPIPEEKRTDVALKYLELAREEILYRVKSSNDTLTVYAGAVGAISAWVYKSSQDLQTAKPPNDLALSIPPLTLSAGLVVSFLSLVASWIVFHNERMVGALARYQREDLKSDLYAPGIVPWEGSESLKYGDPRRLTLVTSIVYAAMIIGPSVVACYEMWSHRRSFSHPWVFLVMSAIMTLFAVVFMSGMVVDRWKLRPAMKGSSKKKGDGAIAKAWKFVTRSATATGNDLKGVTSAKGKDL